MKHLVSNVKDSSFREIMGLLSESHKTRKYTLRASISGVGPEDLTAVVMNIPSSEIWRSTARS
jgi:hypothetical protein